MHPLLAVQLEKERLIRDNRPRFPTHDERMFVSEVSDSIARLSVYGSQILPRERETE